MDFISVFIISIGLAMDAFAVSVSNGIVIPDLKVKHMLRFGIYFGLFQFIMPILGYLGGSLFSSYISAFDHWIAFILLGVIGGKMLFEAFQNGDACKVYNAESMMSFKNMTLLAIATSIDAMAVGISFAMVGTNILLSSTVIGIVAFVFSFCGVYIGKKLGCVFQKGSEILGGTILISIGTKILLEHLFF